MPGVAKRPRAGPRGYAVEGPRHDTEVEGSDGGRGSCVGTGVGARRDGGGGSRPGRGRGPSKSLAVSDDVLDSALLDMIESALPLQFVSSNPLKAYVVGVVMVHSLGRFPADEAAVQLWKRCPGRMKNFRVTMGFRSERTLRSCSPMLYGQGKLVQYVCEVEVQEGMPLFVARNAT